jgi:glycosyltransferase involved in cell wall biosynthesis
MAVPPPLQILGVYHDAPEFGDHEETACRGIEALAGEPDLGVACFFREDNPALAGRLRGIAASSPNVRLRPLGFARRRLEAVQRDIETSITGIRAAREIGIPAVSLLELPHRLQTRKMAFGRSRDLMNSRLFRYPDAFVASSGSIEELLRQRGVRQPVLIIPPAPGPTAGIPLDPTEARARLHLPPAVRLVGMIGSIDFNQKRPDFLLRCLAENYARMDGVELVFAGVGPDLERLRSLARDLGVLSSVHFLGPSADRSDLLAALDLLCIPSRYESLPQILVDARRAGLPVVASALESMNELLPPESLFPTEDLDACAGRILSLLETPRDTLSSGAAFRPESDLSPASYAEHFVTCIRELTGMKRVPVINEN